MHEWWELDLPLILAILRRLRRGQRVYIVHSAAGTRLLAALAVFAIVTAGCGAASTPDAVGISEAVQATVAALPAPTQAPTLPPVEVTRVVEVEVTRIVEATRIVEVISTPQPAAQEPPGSLVKFPEIMASQDDSGMILSVDGVSIVSFADMPAEFQAAVSAFDYWDNIATVIALSIVLTNTTGATLNIYPDQGVIVAGSQQADADTWSSDDVGGEIFAGVTKSGLVLFGLPQPVDPASLASIRYIVSAATDQNYSAIGADYDLTLDLAP